MDDKITIIEGPTPTFEVVNDGWVLGLYEGPKLADVSITRLRTYSGPALVERCHRAWRNQQNIHLEFRSEDGLEQQAPIVAARHVETDDGHMLVLWVRMENEAVELELGYEDDEDEGSDNPGRADLP